jgi:hypothetical protein
MVERLLEKESREKEEVSEILAEVAKQSPANPLERTRLRREQRDSGGESEGEAAQRKWRPMPSPKPRLGEI